jgi:hypothetical protein
LDATVTPGYHNFGGELLVPTEDEDGDGANNGSEALAGTDPRDPADYFRVVSTSNSGTEIVLEWSSLEGKSYNIEYSTTQEPGSWIVINPAPIPGSAEGKSSFQDTDPGRLAEPEGYYRAVVFP